MMRSIGTSDNGSLSTSQRAYKNIKPYCLPNLPPERHDSTAEETKNAGHCRNATGDDESIHHRAENKLANLHKRRAFEYITNGVEVLILWVFDEPHRPGAHDTSASREQDRELVPTIQTIISGYDECNVGCHSHEHGPKYPVVEHRCQRRIHQERSSRTEAPIGEQPDRAYVEHDTTTKREDDQLDDDECRDLDHE